MQVTSLVYCAVNHDLVVHILQDASGDSSSLSDSELALAASSVASVSSGKEMAALGAQSHLQEVTCLYLPFLPLWHN